MANEEIKAKAVESLAIPEKVDTSKWTEEQVSYAPYWVPNEGEKFIARLVQKDVDPEDKVFSRYLLQAQHDLACAVGPKDDQEKVIVKKGEYFTISVYFALQGLFDLYIQTNHKPWMEITSVSKKKTQTAGREVWTWKVRVSPEDKRKADAIRATLQAAAEPKQITDNAS